MTKSSRYLVDPELVGMLDMFPALDLSVETLPATRQSVMEFMPQVDTPDDVSLEKRSVPGISGAPDVELLVYRPRGVAGPLPAILYIHGGGYVVGWPEGSGQPNIRMVRELGCVLVAVRYRLAPETIAPGQVEDCYAGLRWLHDQADALDVDRSRIAIAGESAGGGLGAALAIYARDRGEVAVCFQSLMYPMLEDRLPADGPHPFTGEFVWTAKSHAQGWRSLLGTDPGADTVPPYAAAARVADLSNLPPAYIAVGSIDFFLEEDVAYAMRLMRAGVQIELHVYPGAFHGFDLISHAAVARQADADRMNALVRAFARNDGR